MKPQLKFSSAEILEELNRILSVQEFQNSPVLSRFLEYVVRETIEGREKELKEYNIAVEALARKTDFNPQFDAIVRIHAGRLRRFLQEYYRGPGRNDRIIISMPKGSYAILFDENTGAELTPAPSTKNQIPPNDKITVAVMPFRNLGTASNDFFAEGLGEQLSVELARYDIHKVIAYYSSRYVAAQKVSVMEAGDMLGAGYILTGTVLRNKNKLHVYAQLIDSKTSEQLWVHTFERNNIGTDLFEIQNEIVQQVVNKTAGYYGAIFRNTAKLACEKSIEDMSVYDAVFCYYSYKNKFTNEAFQRARRALRHAVKADPGYALAWALLGEIYGDSYIMRFNTVEQPLQHALDCVRTAIKLDPSCQHAYHALTWIYTVMHNKPEALEAAENCIAVNPNAMFTIGSMGFAFICLGDFEHGIKLLKDSIQLNPFFPWWFNAGFSFYYFHKKEYEEALRWAEKMYMPQVPWDAILQAACLGKMGRKQEAASCLNNLVLSNPGIQTRLKEYISMFLSSDELIDGLYDGLVRAGLEEIKNPALRRDP